MNDETDGQGRISRWSKRKSAHRRGDLPPAGAETAGTSADEQSDDAERAAELEANREAAEAVDLETLDETSDFSVFMKAGVPEALRKTALAILWRSNPVFANVDGLVDYDDDFASPDLILKTFESAWQSGRGYGPAGDGEEETPSVEDAQARTKVADPAAEADRSGDDAEPADPAREDAAEAAGTEEAPDGPTPDPAEGGDPTATESDANERPKVSLRTRLMPNGG